VVVEGRESQKEGLRDLIQVAQGQLALVELTVCEGLVDHLLDQALQV
jgi:hypothetical protein